MPLPTWIDFPDPSDKPSRADLNASATSISDTQATVAAENAPLRILYGRPRIGAQVANILVYQNKLIVHAIWGEGPIQSVDSFTIGNEAPIAGVTATHYLGTSDQTPDPTLVAAFASIGRIYSDALPNIAYSVFAIPVSESNGYPTIEAIVKGRLVYDPRTGLTVWSDNPSLCLADLITNVTYGLARSVDWDSVTAAANANDELVGGIKRRKIDGLAIDSVSLTRQHVEALRAYAGCFIDDGSTIKLIPDRPRATDLTVSASDVLAGSLRMRKRGLIESPTVIIVKYTDTQTTPWAEKTATAYAPGVLEGTTPRRESEISLPGIHTYAQAYREAVERLNHFLLEDLELEWGQFDNAIKIEVGNVVSMTHPIGLSSKLLRVTYCKATAPGRWKIMAREYDPAAYSDSVNAEPTYEDTSLPNPAAPPALTGIQAVEEVFQMENGAWSSRIKATWNAVSYPYLRNYRVELWSQGELIASASPDTPIFRSSAVKEAVEYTVKACAVTTIGATGTWAQDIVTPQGKYLIPSDVPSVTVFEAGGRVYGRCLKATDIDILRYEWRYWRVGESWEVGIVLEEADALTLQVDTIPVGTWVIGVKAIDSVLQSSVNAATATVTVSSDANSFFVNAYESDTPALTNMVAYKLTREDPNTHYITDDGVSWADKFPNAMSTYTDPLGTYHGSVTSTWLGEAEDFGQLLGGQWSGEAVVAALNGAYSSYMGFSPDDSVGSYTYLSGLSNKTNARFARIKHEALGANTMIVTVPGQTIRLDAVPREENHPGTSSATHPVTVHLDNEYVSTKRITITAMSSTAVATSPDAIGLDAPSPNDKHANITITNTNTVTANTGALWTFVRGRHSLPTTGKWYWESKINAVGANSRVMGAGVCSRTASLANTYSDTASMIYYSLNGNRYPGAVAYGATYTTGDVIGVAYDADNGTIEFFKNNVSQGLITGLTGEKFLTVGHYDTDASVTLRINKSDFGYTPPTGFKALPYGFDVGVFDTAGARVARDFLSNFQGV